MLIEELQSMMDILEINIDLLDIKRSYKIESNEILENNAREILELNKLDIYHRDKKSLTAICMLDQTEELYRAIKLITDLKVMDIKYARGLIANRFNQYYSKLNSTRYTRTPLEKENYLILNSIVYYTPLEGANILNKPRLHMKLYENLISELYTRIANSDTKLTTKKLRNLQKYKIINTIKLAIDMSEGEKSIKGFPVPIIYIIDNSDLHIISSDCKLYRMNPRFKINTRALRKSNTESIAFKFKDIKNVNDILIECGDISTFVDIRQLYLNNIITTCEKEDTLEKRIETALFNTPDIFNVAELLRSQLPNCIVMTANSVLLSLDYKYSIESNEFIRGNNDRPLELSWLNRDIRVASEIKAQIQRIGGDNKYEEIKQGESTEDIKYAINNI